MLTTFLSNNMTTTTTTYKKQHLLVLNTCVNAWPGVSEVYSNGLELLFDAVELARCGATARLLYGGRLSPHGDCGFLSALAHYATFHDETTTLLSPVTITHIAFVKSDAVYDPYATEEEAWSQKLEVEFESLATLTTAPTR